MSSDKSRSQQLYERALRVMPGGVSRNAVVRKPHPCYVAFGKGCYVTDVEGVERIDFANNMASLIHGHAFAPVADAVTRQVQLGTAFNLATEVEVDYAEFLCARTPGFEKIRFVNSGTEAIMCAVKAARAYTQRPKIAKVEGAYHGLYDYAEVSQTAAPANWGEAENPRSVPVSRGTPDSALNDVVVLPFNNPKVALELLDRHAAEIACVLVDPLPHRVGFIPASAEFVRALRNWTLRNNALLVFDEVITYRSEYSGAQQWFADRPDLTAMGKMIGGGFPVGALAGRGEVMDVLNPLADKVLFPHSGTFSANPVTLSAGLAAMRAFDQDAVKRLNKLGDYARHRLDEVIHAADVPLCVTGGGSIFRIHPKAKAPANYRESYPTPPETLAIKALLEHFFQNGILLIGTCSGTLSTPMTEVEIEKLAAAFASGIQKIKPMLMQPVGAKG